MSDLQAQRLAKLLSLQHAIQEITSLKEFGFFVVNETHQLVGYDSAALWEISTTGQVRILALSGIAQVNKQTPLVQWQCKIIKHILTKDNQQSTHPIDKNALPHSLTRDWPQGLPEYLLWCPFYRDGFELSGGMLIARDHEWLEKDLQMLDWLVRTYSFCWFFITYKLGFKSSFKRLFDRKKTILIGIIAVIAILMFIPVTQTVLAPSEVIAKEPEIITSVMQGVINEVYVKPNQPVAKDQLLFTMDKTDLENANQLAHKALEVTSSKFQKAIQKGFDDKKARSEINVLKAQIIEQQLQVNYTKELLDRAQIKSPKNGIVIFESLEETKGKPVATGEKIMMVAYPEQIELEVWLPVADAVEFEIGSPIKLYSNVDPLNPINGKITQISYQAQLTPKNILAYRLIAELDDPDKAPQLGTQGTTKIYGNKVSLFFYVLRRPITALRQTLGW